MKTVKCSRCGRRFRMGAQDAPYWNAVFHDGIMTGALCPDCQTDAEDLEAQVNDAVFDYSKAYVRDGRVHAPYKDAATTEGRVSPLTERDERMIGQLNAALDILAKNGTEGTDRVDIRRLATTHYREIRGVWLRMLAFRAAGQAVSAAADAAQPGEALTEDERRRVAEIMHAIVSEFTERELDAVKALF